MTAVAAGYTHSLGLGADGTVWAWGCNIWGQLGDGSFANGMTPVQVKLEEGRPLEGVKALAGGRGHSLALRGDGTVWAWGYNGHRQLGCDHPGSILQLSPVPVVVRPGVPLTDVVAVAGGASHSLALCADGTVWEWGFSPANALTPTEPMQVRGLERMVAVAGGENHSLALDAEGVVWAWGSNWWGQMGDGSTAPCWQPVRVQSPELTGVVVIASGFNHCLAIRSDGTVWAWGNNAHGQAGHPRPFSVGAPWQVPGIAGARRATAGGDHSVVVADRA